MPDRKHQVQIMLPRDLVKRVNAIAERRGHVRSQLFHGWAYAAALAATDGRADLLPPVRAWPLGDDPVQVGWSQAAVESKEWTKRIRTAGSSLRGVIHAASNAYIEADGSVDRARLSTLLDHLNALPGERGYVTETFCERARYFMPENG